MEPTFWQERWARNQIGFHLSEVNPYLLQYWPQLDLAEGAKVLVPLCGKSLDLIWLASHGHPVLGIELSELAVEAFFDEQNLTPRITRRGEFKVYQAGSIELWCGDFFALAADAVADCTALYDRAALIALPPLMRARYAEHLSGLLQQGCQGLLVTLDYDQTQKAGPPFAVTDDEVRVLFGSHWTQRKLAEQDILSESWKFVQDGVTHLDERVYRLVLE
ncbi:MULTISPECIES: thiopurine S-methyltransferase [Pseudomonas]|jgi:thiopurine S-methyltransferase|uniref:Thiopurine S-methyltransferase n=2 Tax=Pseudomonas TaxID=286 RepID=A0A4Y9TFE5_PSEFL|nr:MULTISPECIES: thiopurine S-methyltransferase [Pseudomonas]CRM92819.1 Thiopurine S-methyltransferase [Pseudomonas sp. 22 E 5]MCX9151291.1 thiopurine S-methyltransferase [Pseudomonas sp. TB1-B1]QXH69077.1 thiopurine S-methyltransferase [Pseudomonas asgharzadehiana]TFW41577.1 thiopurine S-methyltransferase [Pseudomonas fluorescens]TKJ58153.1 thiopurine S-methyltransferase [Pseudomonas sp. CFBP13506]